jgi:hypothetical protein
MAEPYSGGFPRAQNGFADPLYGFADPLNGFQDPKSHFAQSRKGFRYRLSPFDHLSTSLTANQKPRLKTWL